MLKTGPEFSLITDPKNAVRITPPAERRTSRFLTKYEMAKVVGMRATQIAEGTAQQFKSRSVRGWGLGSHTPDTAMVMLTSGSSIVPPLNEVKTTMARSDPVQLALKELIHRRIPFVVRRTFPDGRTEDIPLKDLEVDPAFSEILQEDPAYFQNC